MIVPSQLDYAMLGANHHMALDTSPALDKNFALDHGIRANTHTIAEFHAFIDDRGRMDIN